MFEGNHEKTPGPVICLMVSYPSSSLYLKPSLKNMCSRALPLAMYSLASTIAYFPACTNTESITLLQEMRASLLPSTIFYLVEDGMLSNSFPIRDEVFLLEYIPILYTDLY